MSFQLYFFAYELPLICRYNPLREVPTADPRITNFTTTGFSIQQHDIYREFPLKVFIIIYLCVIYFEIKKQWYVTWVYWSARVGLFYLKLYLFFTKFRGGFFWFLSSEHSTPVDVEKENREYADAILNFWVDLASNTGTGKDLFEVSFLSVVRVAHCFPLVYHHYH